MEGQSAFFPTQQQPIHQSQPQTSPIMSAQTHAYTPAGQMAYSAPSAYPQLYQHQQQVAQHQQLSQQAALANATAAATGPHWNMQGQSMQVQDLKQAKHSSILGDLGRRLSHAASPVVQNQIPARPPTAMPPPGDNAGPAEDTPLYVNAKQFHRILKRRQARQKLEEQLRLTSKARKPYLHESRHKHAMRRPRGPGGRFLTSDEVAALEKKEQEAGGAHSDGSNGIDALHSAVVGSKRKAGAPTHNSKKSKNDMGAPAVRDPGTVDDDDEEDGYADDG